MNKFPDHLKPASPQGPELLKRERTKATFDSGLLAQFLQGQEQLERQARILAILEKEKAFDKSKRYFQGREERLRHAFFKEKRLVELIHEHHWDKNDIATAELLLDEPGPLSLHRSMFIPTLTGQGTPEQQRDFLTKALNYEIIGCYAQTELGHGSNIQRLETTATYHPETREFELLSPTLTASKWWIGGLGLAATHAVVVARLITKGKDYGPHTFVVPIRSLKDHQPLPGITVGDIGPKFGFNSVDNGFILFDRVRIPRSHMLARFSSVTPSGEYQKPPNSKLSYGTMVLVRASIVRGASVYLARATTIATRYLAVRRQFVDDTVPLHEKDPPNTEVQVIDYTMVQYRLFPVIAQAYALAFTGRWMMNMYNKFTERLGEGDIEMLADVHASSSGLKSLTSNMAVDGVEVCRRACGGHGYSAFSGLTTFYGDILPNVTWEGDNYILTQQTTRYLLKKFREVAAQWQTGDHTSAEAKNLLKNETAAYIHAYLTEKAKDGSNNRWPVRTAADVFDPQLQIRVFIYRSARIIERTAHLLDHEKRTWNEAHVEIARASRAHCQLILVNNFIVAINQPDIPDSLRTPLKALSHLFVLHMLEQELAEVLEGGYVTDQQVEWVRDAVRQQLAKIRPNAVALVDAFAIPDFLLHSALGRYDGRVYESMTEMASLEPANQTKVVAGYEEFLRPLLDTGLQRTAAALRNNAKL